MVEEGGGKERKGDRGRRGFGRNRKITTTTREDKTEDRIG